VFRLIGKDRAATKSLKGRVSVAQPPGATMAVTGKQISTRWLRSKERTTDLPTIGFGCYPL
jgi:hypothetical protein